MVGLAADMPAAGPAYRPEPRFDALGDAFFDEVEAADFPAHTLRWRNHGAAGEVGLEHLEDQDWINHFGYFKPLPDNLPTPLATRYHGHQFGHYNPRLGDGRGFLFAQLRDHRDRLLDLGTKGSGQTPWSRGGDGRLTLKGGVRELQAAALLEARGVDTSRVFSLVETGEDLYRNDEPSPTRSCVMVRLSHSHVRIGSFQRLGFFQQADEMRALVDYCCTWLYPDLADAEGRPGALLRRVVERVAETCAGWMVAGFVHGVLNTDNINITGESFDYGPWRFMAAFDADMTAAYFDHGGRYRYRQQPAACMWALEQLARALSLVASLADLAPALDAFRPAFGAAFRVRFLARLGVRSAGEDVDRALLNAVFEVMDSLALSYDGFFHDWYGGLASRPRAMSGPRGRRYGDARFQPVMTALESHPAANPDRLMHPLLEAPEPLGLERVASERVWDAIAEHDDWQPLIEQVSAFRSLAELIERPGAAHAP